MKITNVFFLVLFLFGLLVCNTNDKISDEPTVDIDEVKEIITQKWIKYSNYAKDKNTVGLVDIWNEDMRLLSDPGGAEDIRSIEEHKNLAETGFKILTVVSLELEADEVSLIDNATAIEIGTWSEEFAISGMDETVKMFGAYMGIWKKKGNDWLLYRYIRNRHDFLNPTFENALNE